MFILKSEEDLLNFFSKQILTEKQIVTSLNNTLRTIKNPAIKMVLQGISLDSVKHAEMYTAAIDLLSKTLVALQDSEEKHRAIFTEAKEGIVLIKRYFGQIVDANPEFERQTGRTLAELRQMKIWDIRPLELKEKAREKFLEISKAGEGSSSELTFLRPDGKEIPIAFSSKVIRLKDEEYIQSISKDITERFEFTQ